MGKVIKSTIPVRESRGFVAAYLFPARVIRRGIQALTGRPITFHYWPLTPNYDHYWEGDSDAVNSLDRYETYLWFMSRGDLRLNCGSEWNTLRMYGTAMVFRVKPAESAF